MAQSKEDQFVFIKVCEIILGIYCESSVCGFCVCLLRRIFVDFSDLDGIRFLCKLEKRLGGGGGGGRKQNFFFLSFFFLLYNKKS